MVSTGEVWGKEEDCALRGGNKGCQRLASLTLDEIIGRTLKSIDGQPCYALARICMPAYQHAWQGVS